MSVHPFFRLKPALAGFLLVFGIAAAQAQSSPPPLPRVDVTPMSNRIQSLTPGGMTTALQTQAYIDNSLTQRTLYQRLTVPLSSGSLGSLAKGILKRGAGAAGAYFILKDLVNGAGWVIDELTNQVMSGPVVAPDILKGVQAWCSSTNIAAPTTRCTALSSPLNLCTWARSQIADANQCVLGNTTSVSQALIVKQPGQWVVLLQKVNIPSAGTGVANEGTGSTPSVVTDAQLGEKVATQPALANQVLTDPQTGAPLRYPEMVEALNALRRQLETANGLDPGPDVVVSPDLSETEQPAATEWPGFCSWATVVCDFIDWVKAEEPETSTPELDIQPEPFVEQTWSSGLGGGSCPSPSLASVSMSGTTQSVEFSVDPICQLGTTMRPWLIALATLLTPMIIGGFRSSKDA